jgi:O-antigen/teichoic acid export membrane protein
VTLFVLFSGAPGSVFDLLAIQALFTLLRQLAFVFRLEASDRAGFWRAELASAAETIRYAGPVTLAEGSIIAIRNAPVMLASRFLGAAEAGYVAVVANTLQGYFNQIFYSVVQPIALPIASRFTLSDAHSPRRRGFMDLESIYALGVAIVFGQLIYWTPAVIPLWLGESFEAIVLATQIMLAGSGMQTIAILRRSVLIGQGVLTEAVPAIVASALASILLMALGVVFFQSWLAAVLFSAVYLFAASGFGVDRIFVRAFGRADTAGPLARFLSVCSIFVAAGAIAELPSSDSPFESIAWAVVALGVTLGLAFATIISPVRSLRLVQKLYRSRGVDLFE